MAIGLALRMAWLASAQVGGAPPLEFRGPDGKPLPPDVQQQLREKYKNGLPEPNKMGGNSDVVVTGGRPRGAVLGDIPPERTLSPIDIRSYGAGTVADLIDALGAQVKSGRGDGNASPVVLLNGRRVSSFNEIARIPTEAIERTDILPEEVALKYGYPADQKVVNVVTFERFSSRVGVVNAGTPTDGGQASWGGTASKLRITGNTRVLLDAQISRSSALLESERGLRQISGDPRLGDVRTLLPETNRVSLGATIAGTPSDALSATLDGRFDTVQTRALVGLSPDGRLHRDNDTQTAHLGTTLGGHAGRWLWTATGNWDRVTSSSMTDTGVTAAPRNDARAVNTTANADLLVSGSPFKLPAGAASASVRAGLATRDFNSVSRWGALTRTSDLGRDTASLQGNIDLPITGGDTPSLAWLGRLSANATLGAEHLSDRGTLRTIGYGLAWAPKDRISVLASIQHRQAAPSIEQLGSPLLVVPNARIFDFVQDQTVDVTRITGSNPGLRTEDRRVMSLGTTIKPFAKTDFVFNIDYADTRINRPIMPLPLAIAQVEAAFPDRFTRDAAGRLQRIDATPLNLFRAHQRQLRWGLSYMKPLGRLPPGLANTQVRVFSSEAEAKRRLPPNAQFIPIEAGSAAARRVENLTSRLMVSIAHSWRLEDVAYLRPGGAPLDLLDGDAIDLRGGRPRHEVEAQIGVFKRGLGARISANWQSATYVRGLGGTAGDLHFASLMTVDLNLFANIGERLGRAKTPPLLRGARLSLNVANILNARQQVRDGVGSTPIIYQPAYLNPLGRNVTLSLRKAL